MKFLVAVILTALLAFVAGLRFEWWTIAVAAFIVGLLVHQKAGKAFLAGAVGIFLLWGLLALFIDIANKGILSKRIADVLPVGGSSVFLILVTALVGALVGGFGAMSGSYLRSRR
jgi:hypothetical protein